MWEKTRLKRGALSVTLALGLVLTSFNPLGVFAKEAGGEQTTAFSESRVLADAGAKELTWKDSYRLDRTVMQDGNVIQNGSNEPTGIINPNKNFRVNMSVELPVATDGNARPYLEKNDFIRIPMIEKGVKLTGNLDLGKLDAKFMVNGTEHTVKNAFSAKVEADNATKTVYMVMTLLVDNNELQDATDLRANIKMDFDVDQDSMGKDAKGNYIYSAEKKIYLGKFDNKFVVEKTGTTTDEVSQAVDALIAEKVDAIFTPTDNTIQKAELSFYEKLIKAKIPHYGGADSFALNGAFAGYGVDYVQLGKATADMVDEVLRQGKDTATLPVQTFDNGIATVNTETAEKLGYSLDKIKEAFKPFCTKIVEIKTEKEFKS